MKGAVWTVVAAALTLAPPLGAQLNVAPTALDQLALNSLAGEWYEVASYGSWSQRSCVADATFTWAVRDTQSMDVRGTCTTASGVETQHGRLRSRDRAHGGQLTIRFAPTILTWLPAVWNDYWVLARGADDGWLLIGDRRRERLSVLSRWIALDEAALAQAIGAARAQGFDVGRLVLLRHGPAMARAASAAWP